MHRTTFLPKMLASRALGPSLFLGFLLGAVAQTASAQGPEGPGADRQAPGFGQQFKELGDPKGGAREVPEPYILVLPKETTKQIEMSTKELIVEVRSDNPKVVRVQSLLENPKAVLVTGVGPGTARVELTDVKKNKESLEVRVPFGDEEERDYKLRTLREQIRKFVPSASVEIQAWKNSPSSPRAHTSAAGGVLSTTTTVAPKWTVTLTGNVRDFESVQIITDLAVGVFEDANVINAMRMGGVQQVQIEVTIARVNRSKARNIGFTFYQTGQQHYLASTPGFAGSVSNSVLTSILSPAATLPASPNAVFGIFNDKEGFFGYLSALTTEGLAKLIAEPRVI